MIKELDCSRLELLPLIRETTVSADLKQDLFNQEIDSRLRDYESRGYVLLDGAIAAALLKNSRMIPGRWAKLTESEGGGSASIRFDGSVYSLANSKNVQLVLKPFASRGRWGWGFGDKYPKLRSAGENIKKEFTVVYKN